MATSRKQHTDTLQSQPSMNLAMAAETLRHGDLSRAPHSPPASEEKMSLFWRVFGGTILSICALVVITVYQQFNSAINDLRASITRINEVQADLVKKEDLSNRTTSIWSSLKEFSATVPVLKTSQTVLENRLQAAEQDRKELTREVQQLQQQVAELKGHLNASAKTTSTK